MVDLRLAPVTLAVDRELQRLGDRETDEVRYLVSLGSDMKLRDEEERASALVRAATHTVDLGGWEPSWDGRGLRLTHGEHTLVLGVSATLLDFVRTG
ncbi:MAG: hypothetical protein GC157_11905 [Frankiales bacterium]|nr:hypothetical protein [Frankiales bacterium]